MSADSLKQVSHRKGAEDAEFDCFLLSADPGGIGSAFHRAEEGGKQKDPSRQSWAGLLP